VGDLDAIRLGVGTTVEEAERLLIFKTLDATGNNKTRAAEILGEKIVFFDVGDYPMRIPENVVYELAGLYRKVRPEFILTHSLKDPYNFDHPLVSQVAQEARMVAQAHGHEPGTPVIGAPAVFLFEPHQPEQCEFKPQVLLDISSVWPKKHDAFKAMNAQEHLWHYYERVALQRGVQASRNSNKHIEYAEAYQRVFPQVTEELA